MPAMLFLIGRILVAGFYLYHGAHHFTQLGAMTGYADSKGVPAPKLAVLGSGALLLIGGLTIVTGFPVYLGVAAISLFFVGVTPVMHAFWKDEDPMARATNKVHFAKNVALLGSTLMFLAIPEPWVYAL